jgi:small conductance mechanosensitive channel
MLNRLFGENIDLTAALIAVAVVVAVAWVAAHFSARGIRLALFRLTDEDEERSFASPIVRTPIRIVWIVVFLLLTATLIFPALELAGAELRFGLGLETLTAWLLRSGLRVTLILMLAYSINRVVWSLVHRIELRIGQEEGPEGLERMKRSQTLSRLVRNLVNTVVLAVAALMVLQELGVNIMPVLTGAGILGLAVGFGAQTLVRDVISGFFVILENQVRVGDVANIDGTGGLVEKIGLRTITLRDLSGTVHIMPNGSIGKLSNLTKDFSFYVLDMGVAYKEDTDEVVRVLEEVAKDLAADPVYGPRIIGPLEVLGVDAFDESQVTIKVRLKTVPIQQWSVGREYRRRIKKAFDARGIEIPFPHLSVYFGEASKPWLYKSADAASAPVSGEAPAPAN